MSSIATVMQGAAHLVVSHVQSLVQGHDAQHALVCCQQPDLPGPAHLAQLSPPGVRFRSHAAPRESKVIACCFTQASKLFSEQMHRTMLVLQGALYLLIHEWPTGSPALRVGLAPLRDVDEALVCICLWLLLRWRPADTLATSLNWHSPAAGKAVKRLLDWVSLDWQSPAAGKAVKLLLHRGCDTRQSHQLARGTPWSAKGPAHAAGTCVGSCTLALQAQGAQCQHLVSMYRCQRDRDSALHCVARLGVCVASPMQQVTAASRQTCEGRCGPLEPGAEGLDPAIGPDAAGLGGCCGGPDLGPAADGPGLGPVGACEGADGWAACALGALGAGSAAAWAGCDLGAEG